MKYLTKKDFDDPDFMIDHYKFYELDDYIEAHAEDLINHKINQEDLYELAHLLLFHYVSSRDFDYREQIKTIYYDLFRYIFKPHSQDYDDATKIIVDAGILEMDLEDAQRQGVFDETLKFVKNTAESEIEFLKEIYELDSIIVSDEILEKIEIENLLKNVREIIAEFAQNDKIRREYCG